MHVMVTGASSGIGEAIAKAFGAAGYDVTLVARRKAELERVGAALGAGVKHRIIQHDLAHLDGTEDLVRRAEEGLGPIDVLINNAGVTLVAGSPSISSETGEQVLRVNLLAPLRLVQAVMPGMIARGAGTIVDITSVAAFAPTMYSIHYNAAKAGLAAASESLRGELKPLGVHVLTVYPGPVETALKRKAYAGFEKTPSMPTGDPDELAGLILRGVRHRWARLTYPRFYYFPKLFPGFARWFNDRFLPPLSSGS